MEVVCTAVLAISYVCSMHMCIPRLSDRGATIHREWAAVQFNVSFINGLLVDQTDVG